jgi:hypothetical protein
VSKKATKSNGSHDRPMTPSKVVALAKKYLEPHQSRDFLIEVLGKAERQVDGWWYVYFRPSPIGLKSYEYEGRIVEAMRDLMDQEKVNVVLLEDEVAHSR